MLFSEQYVGNGFPLRATSPLVLYSDKIWKYTEAIEQIITDKYSANHFHHLQT